MSTKFDNNHVVLGAQAVKYMTGKTLLACPFCGCEPHITVSRYITIDCKRCKSETSFSGEVSMSYKQSIQHKVHLAVIRWNNRVFYVSE
jgi:hypothetical protein